MGCSASNQAQPVSTSSQSPSQPNRPQAQEQRAEAGPSDELRKIEEEPVKDTTQSATTTMSESAKPSPAGENLQPDTSEKPNVMLSKGDDEPREEPLGQEAQAEHKDSVHSQEQAMNNAPSNSETETATGTVRQEESAEIEPAPETEAVQETQPIPETATITETETAKEKLEEETKNGESGKESAVSGVKHTVSDEPTTSSDEKTSPDAAGEGEKEDDEQKNSEQETQKDDPEKKEEAQTDNSTQPDKGEKLEDDKEQLPAESGETSEDKPTESNE